MYDMYCVKHMSPKTVTIPDNTHKRIIKYKARLTSMDGKQRTIGDGIEDLFNEAEWLSKLQAAYAEADKLNEEAKKSGKIVLATQGADVALAVLKAYIQHVKERSK